MKKYLFGLLAIVLAVGFTAFTAPKASNSTDKWFTYSLTHDESQVSNQLYFNITGSGGIVVPSCSGSGYTCAVKVSSTEIVSDVERPILSTIVDSKVKN